MSYLDTQTLVAADVLASYDRPLSVVVVAKVEKFPFLQKLGYNGQLFWLQRGFLGLDDYNLQLELYSDTHPILRNAWNLIKDRAPLNLRTATKLYPDPALGVVGDAFLELIGFSQVFAVNPDQLRATTGSSLVAKSLPSI